MDAETAVQVGGITLAWRAETPAQVHPVCEGLEVM